MIWYYEFLLVLVLIWNFWSYLSSLIFFISFLSSFLPFCRHLIGFLLFLALTIVNLDGVPRLGDLFSKFTRFVIHDPFGLRKPNMWKVIFASKIVFVYLKMKMNKIFIKKFWVCLCKCIPFRGKFNSQDLVFSASFLHTFRSLISLSLTASFNHFSNTFWLVSWSTIF